MANRQIIDIGQTGAIFNIDLGDICSGETFDLQFCNTDGTHTYTFNECACPAFSGLPATSDFTDCECKTFPVTFTGNGYPGSGQCLLLVTRSGGHVVRVNITYNEVYCEPLLSTWAIGNDGNAVVINDSTFDHDCEVSHNFCMAQRLNFSKSYTIAQPLVAGDVLFLSQWLFAQMPAWAFQDYPIAGWKYRVCLHTPEEGEPTVDGTFNMEWYGESPSEENSARTPYVSVVISSGGTTIQYQVKFNLGQDLQTEPSNSGVQNSLFLLNNAISNPFQLNNEAENSIYRNPKYMSWASVIYRTIGAVYQPSFFNVKGEFPFYNEMSVSASPLEFTINSVELARTATGTDTEYFSTARPTSVVVDFDYISVNPSGTLPDSMHVYLIRVDTSNNQLDYYQNYEYEQANLFSLAPQGNITPTTAPTLVSGNNFTAEFDISALHPAMTGVPINYAYRMIFVVGSTADNESRSSISDRVDLINYDDEPMPLNTLSVAWRTLEQEYPTTDRIVQGACVNLPLESVIRLDLTATNAELSAKTNGLVNDASQALQSVRLDVYETNPLTGNLLLDTMFFQPEIKRICNDNFEKGTEVDFVDASNGAQMEIVFPFTIPDNIYRNIGREGLFQRPQGSFGRVPVVDASLDCVIASGTNHCNLGTSFGQMNGMAGVARYAYMAYIPQTTEVWVSNNVNDEIHIFDANTFTQVGTIAVGTGNTFRFIRVGNNVYLSGGTGDVYVVNIFTRALTTTISVDTTLGAMAYNSVANTISIVEATNQLIYRIDVATNTIIGAPLAIPVVSTDSDLIYVSLTNELWLSTGNPTQTIEVINYTTFLIVATIAQVTSVSLSPMAQWNGNVYSFRENAGGQLDIIDIATRLVTATTAVPPIVVSSLSQIGGVIYFGDGIGDNIYGYDGITLQQITNTFVATSARVWQVITANGCIFASSRSASFLETIFLFDADCQTALPPFSMANRNIEFEWSLEFAIFDNTENYFAYQRIERPKLSELIGVDVLPIDSIEDAEIDGTPVGTATPCPTTGVVTVTGTWGASTANRQLFAVAVEIMPVRAGLVSMQTSQPQAGNVIIPVNSPFIANLQPQFNSVGNISFELDYPELPIQGDYQIRLHFIARY